MSTAKWPVRCSNAESEGCSGEPQFKVVNGTYAPEWLCETCAKTALLEFVLAVPESESESDRITVAVEDLGGDRQKWVIL